MKVVGYRKSSFTGDDGQEVSGYNFYLTWEITKDGEGSATERVYVLEKRLNESGYFPSVGDEVEPQYNRFGKCTGFTLAG